MVESTGAVVAEIDALPRFIRHRHTAERRLEVLGERQGDDRRRGRHRAADCRARMVEEGMGLPQRRGAQHHRANSECHYDSAHHHHSEIGLPMLRGKMSSRYKCNCPRNPTVLPLW